MPEVDVKCCLCIPAKCGLTIISVLYALSAVFVIGGGIMALGVNPAAGIFGILTGLPCILIGFFCVKWMMKDEAETRKKLVLAMLIGIVATILQAVATIIML